MSTANIAGVLREHADARQVRSPSRIVVVGDHFHGWAGEMIEALRVTAAASLLS
jgi:hypothetical protein